MAYEELKSAKLSYGPWEVSSSCSKYTPEMSYIWLQMPDVHAVYTLPFWADLQVVIDFKPHQYATHQPAFRLLRMQTLYKIVIRGTATYGDGCTNADSGKNCCKV